MIPSSVSVIEESCFEGCIALEDIEIPSSVKVIERSAFKNCKAIKISKFRNLGLTVSLLALH